MPLLPLNDFMSVIAEAPNGDIWLGSFGTGVAVYHPDKNVFTLYNQGNSQLSNDHVQSIFCEVNGDVWIGTSSGLNLLDHATGKINIFLEKDGLANSIVYKILADNSGLLWLSTDKGISSFDKRSRKFYNYTWHNGVQQSPFISGSGLRSANGELYFGGQDGFNYFNPAALPHNSYSPPVLLTDLKIDNVSVNPGESAAIKMQIGVANEFKLAYGQNFSISYAAINYTSPQQNQYAYQLKGFDKNWNMVQNAKTAHYTNLDPGNYVFEVKATDNEGLWNGKVTSIKVTVLPPFWRTAYAYLIYLIIASVIIYYIRRRNRANLRRIIAEEQEKLVAAEERRESERLHELDSLKIKFLTNLSHEFRTPISLIMAPADKLLSAHADPAINGQIQMIRRNARRLLNMVNQLLDFRKMEEHELKLNLVPGDLVLFIKETGESFHDLCERKKINLEMEFSIDKLLAYFDPNKLERIVFNLLSNAFKFTIKGGAIKIRLLLAETTASGDQQYVVLEISDTGIGIPEEHIDRIFERFFQNNDASAILNQGSGIGLSITKEFVELHGGTISVKSLIGQGTTFTVTIPVVPVTDIQQDPPKLFHESSLVEDVPESAIVQSLSEHELPCILLVEDNDDYRLFLSENLKAFYTIIEASDGKEGWQKALSAHPQLIISDVSMPNMNGIELSRKIKADKRTGHIPVILLTAITGEEDQLKGLESGANDYLSKPFNFEILNTKIKNLLILNQTLKSTYSKQIKMTGQEIQIESSDAKLLSKVVKYIEDKLNDSELSVEELSKHVGMSRGSLYHKILEMTGLTPIEYIRAVKLEKAAALLEKSDYNVAQICYMTGFGTPSYFSRMFKAKYHMLPSEYLSEKRRDNKLRTEAVHSAIN